MFKVISLPEATQTTLPAVAPVGDAPDARSE